MIVIVYLEGQKQKWQIHRRYSDFQELHFLLQDYFATLKSQDPNFFAPIVPPKISTKSIDTDALDIRRRKLENYLT